MKPRYKRRILWSILGVFAAAIIAVIIVPPFISLNAMRPGLESAIFAQTGTVAKINGDVNFSLLGGLRIMAHNIKVENGTIKSVEFNVPLSKIFNLKSATISDTIWIYGADLSLINLVTPNIGKELIIYDSSATFMGKKYTGISGTLQDGLFKGAVRTSQHKYNFDATGNNFHITNESIGLEITGTSSIDQSGNMSAAGTFLISTNDANKFFEFDVPKISGNVSVDMKFEWKNDWFRFYDINGTFENATFSGEIEFDKDKKSISIMAKNLDFDLSFLLKDAAFIKNSDFNVDLSGNLKFMTMDFARVKLISTSDKDKVNISNLEFYSSDLSGSIFGTITGDDANLFAKILRKDDSISCNFSGTSTNWSCHNFIYSSRDFSALGRVNVNTEKFDMDFISDDFTGDVKDLTKLANFLSQSRGTIHFRLSNNTVGHAEIDGKNTDITYYNIDSTRLSDIGITNNLLKLLPKGMMTKFGKLNNIVIKNNELIELDFGTDDWLFNFDGDGNFGLTGNLSDLLSEFYPAINFGFLSPNIPINITGKYKQPYFTNLNIETISHKFSGSFDGRALNLRGELLDMDAALNSDYIDNYESEQFLMPEPLFAPFALNLPIVISVDAIKYGGEKYANFVYSLHGNTQEMSITDSARGNILLSIQQKKTKYDIILKVSDFALLGNVLRTSSPINLSDTTLTAAAKLSTSGIISNDVWHNLSGDIELTFIGGTLSGIGIDDFYKNLQNISRLNISDAVAGMLDGGKTEIRTMRLSGIYDNNIFTMTQPFTISTKNAKMSGDIIIDNGRISAIANIMLRSASLDPKPFTLRIMPNGAREYSVSDILMNIDLDYLVISNY